MLRSNAARIPTHAYMSSTRYLSGELQCDVFEDRLLSTSLVRKQEQAYGMQPDDKDQKLDQQRVSPFGLCLQVQLPHHGGKEGGVLLVVAAAAVLLHVRQPASGQHEKLGRRRMPRDALRHQRTPR